MSDKPAAPPAEKLTPEQRTKLADLAKRLEQLTTLLNAQPTSFLRQ